jgi:hypothetical protein
MVEILGSAPSHTLLIGTPSQYQNNILNEIAVQRLANGGTVALLADSLSQVNTAKSELVALAKERGVTERQLGRLFPIPDVPRLGVEKLSDTISGKAGRGENLLVVHDLSGHVAGTKSDRVWFTTVKSILAFLRCNVLTAASYGAEPNRQSADYSADCIWSVTAAPNLKVALKLIQPASETLFEFEGHQKDGNIIVFDRTDRN